MAKNIKRTSRAVAASRTLLDQLIALPASYLDQLAELLNKRLQRHLPEGEKMPNIRLFLRLLIDEIRMIHSALLSSDQARVEEATDQVLTREAMKTSELALRGRIRFTRTAVETSYGKAGLDCVPFNAAEARTAEGLLDQSEYMLQRLPDLEGRKPLFSEGQGDSAINLSPPPQVLVEGLGSRIGDFKVKRQIYLEEVRNSRTAGAGQKDLLTQFETDASNVREIVKRLFLLVGLETLAEQLKISRRSSRSEKETPAPAATNDPPTREHAI